MMTIANQSTRIFCMVWLLFVCAAFLQGATTVINKDQTLKTSPEWQAHYDEYQPDEGLLLTWQAKIGENLAIEVYLGTWCSDSRNNVPPLMKLLDSLEQGRVAVKYHDVPRKASADVKYYVEELKVERVPTFIFYRDGQEIGRIVENPQKSMLEDFIEIIF